VGLAQIGPWISWAANQVQNSLLPMTSSGGFLFYCNFLTLPPLHTNFLHLANLNLQLALGRRTFSTSISNRFASRLFCHRHSSQRFGAHTKFHSRLSFTDSSRPIWDCICCHFVSRQRLRSNCARKSPRAAYLKKSPESRGATAFERFWGSFWHALSRGVKSAALSFPLFLCYNLFYIFFGIFMTASWP